MYTLKDRVSQTKANSAQIFDRSRSKPRFMVKNNGEISIGREDKYKLLKNETASISDIYVEYTITINLKCVNSSKYVAQRPIFLSS